MYAVQTPTETKALWFWFIGAHWSRRPIFPKLIYRIVRKANTQILFSKSMWKHSHSNRMLTQYTHSLLNALRSAGRLGNREFVDHRPLHRNFKCEWQNVHCIGIYSKKTCVPGTFIFALANKRNNTSDLEQSIYLFRRIPIQCVLTMKQIVSWDGIAYVLHFVLVSLPRKCSLHSHLTVVRWTGSSLHFRMKIMNSNWTKYQVKCKLFDTDSKNGFAKACMSFRFFLRFSHRIFTLRILPGRMQYFLEHEKHTVPNANE